MDIPGEIPAGSRLKRQFSLMNPSSGDLRFEWKRSNSVCTVEPSYGVIPAGQMCPLQLCVEAEVPGNINEILKCGIESGNDLLFKVIANVKPPQEIVIKLVNLSWKNFKN
jgi:hypothetical protein